VIELFRFAFLGSGVSDLSYWMISIVVTVLVFILGAAMFNRIERSFVDTI
jgi:lipopolysaccharide transport system permease protein